MGESTNMAEGVQGVAAEPRVRERIARTVVFAAASGVVGGCLGMLLFGTPPGVEVPMALLNSGAIGGCVGGLWTGWTSGGSMRRWCGFRA